MVTIITLLLSLAMTAACWYSAQALLHYTMGADALVDTPFRRFYLCVFLLLVAISHTVDFPWGPGLDAFWWLALIGTLEMTAALGVRMFVFLVLASLVKRLAVIGLLKSLA